MRYIPCNCALLTQETLFLTPKSTFFAQSVPKSAQIATNFNIPKNNVLVETFLLFYSGGGTDKLHVKYANN